MAKKPFSRLAQGLGKENSASPDSPTTPADTAIAPGVILHQRFRLDGEIGRGGMGIVYRARDLTNDREVAVKVINLDKANALSLAQFNREAEFAAKLVHPHIVQVFETGNVPTKQGGTLPYIVMELVRGAPLSELADLTYVRIVDIARQICDALQYAHQQGVIYRDLKPGNVLLEKQGFTYFAKLLDFGLARSRGESYLPNESTMAGTLFYLAPELISGQPADIASDLYALGAVLYEMITGRVPFSDFDEQAILSQHLNEAVAPPSDSRTDVPPALNDLVIRLLAKNPKERPASVAEVIRILEPIELELKSQRSAGNLPDIGELVVQEADIQHIKELLASNLRVTILGGDINLALATGMQMAEDFPDGVWFVDLASVNEPSLVLPTIAVTLNIPANPNRPLTISLLTNLREKHLLLILAHCEHVLSACTQFVETVTQTCPEVRIIAVSRQPLNLPDEKKFTLS